jgi:hypothetical protein
MRGSDWEDITSIQAPIVGPQDSSEGIFLWIGRKQLPYRRLYHRSSTILPRKLEP